MIFKCGVMDAATPIYCMYALHWTFVHIHIIVTIELPSSPTCLAFVLLLSFLFTFRFVTFG